MWILVASPGFSQEPLVLSTADTAPFSTPANDGLYDLVLADAFDRLGLDLEIRHLPSERSLVEANAGHVDGEYGRTSRITDLYPHLLIVPEPLGHWAFSAFVRSGTPEPDSFESLRDYHVAYIRGWKVYEENVTAARSVTIVNSEDQLFQMLAAGRVDVILYNRARGEHRLHARRGQMIDIVEPPLASQPMYLFLHERHQAYVAPLAATLREMKTDGSYDRHRRRAFGEP
jgi:polar amino acid transport system substrate-binding protein